VYNHNKYKYLVNYSCRVHIADYRRVYHIWFRSIEYNHNMYKYSGNYSFHGGMTDYKQVFDNRYRSKMNYTIDDKKFMKCFSNKHSN
jgi:hypothetical protein